MPPRRAIKSAATRPTVKHDGLVAGDKALLVAPDPTRACVNPVSAFLASLQLQGYSELFVVDHGFRTLELLAAHIRDEQDLVEMGIRPLAHRRAIMAGIQRMRKTWIATADVNRIHHVPPHALSANLSERPTIRLEPRLSFAEQLQMFKLRQAATPSRQDSERATNDEAVHPAVPNDLQGVLGEEKVPACASMLGSPNMVTILSGNSLQQSSSPASVAKIRQGNDDYQHHNRLSAFSCEVPLRRAERHNERGIAAITEMVVHAEDSYLNDLRTLEEDAKAAAHTLSELFKHRADTIEHVRQQRLQDAVAMVGVDGRDALDMVAARCAARRNTSSGEGGGMSSVVSGWVFQVNLHPIVKPAHQPPMQETAQQTVAPEEADHQVHVDVARGILELTPEERRNSSNLPRHSSTHFPSPQPLVASHHRRSARRSVSSSARGMRHSIRRVEHWLNDAAADGAAVGTTPTISPLNHNGSLESGGMEGATVCPATTVPPSSPDVDVVDESDHCHHLNSRAPSVVPAPVVESEQVTLGLRLDDPALSADGHASSDDGGDESVIALMDTHVSCSQRIVLETTTSSRVLPAAMQAIDVVDVDAASSYYTTSSRLSLPEQFGVCEPQRNTKHVGARLSDDDRSSRSNVGVSPFNTQILVSDEENNSYDEIEVGEVYDAPFGGVEMGEGASCFFVGDEVNFAGSLSEDSRGSRSAESGHIETELFEDEEDESVNERGQLHQTGNGLPPRSPAPCGIRSVLLDAHHSGAAPSNHSVSSVARSTSGVGASSRSLFGLVTNGTRSSKPMFHDRYTRSDIDGMTTEQVLDIAAQNGMDEANNHRKRPRTEANGDVSSFGECASGRTARRELHLLHTRSAFLSATRDLLASSIPSMEDPTGSSTSRKRHSSIPRLQQAERQALTQAELNDIRRQMREAEAAEANNALVAALAHQSLCSMIARTTCHVEEEGGVAQAPLLTPYDAALLGEGVALEDVLQVVRDEFPGLPKSRIELALKASGVPINVVKNSPKETNRRRFFTQGWAGRRGGGRNR